MPSCAWKAVWRPVARAQNGKLSSTWGQRQPKSFQVGPKRRQEGIKDCQKAVPEQSESEKARPCKNYNFPKETPCYYLFLQGQQESKLRLEASLDGQIESKWRLQARLEAKLRLEGG